MKILWFTNTPCGASQKMNPNSQIGGWLASLEKCLTGYDDIDLHICFLSEGSHPTFSIGRTTYHPVRRTRTKEVLLSRLAMHPKLDPVESYADVIDRVKPDLIHVHGTEEDFGLVQSVTKIPVVVSIQGILSSIQLKYFSGIPAVRFLINENFVSHCKLKSVLSNFLIFKKNASRERKILSMSRHVIGRTDFDRRSMAVLAPYARYYRGDEILRPDFYQQVWSRPEFSSPLRIVTVSSGSPYKGFETVLQVSQILQEHTDIEFMWNVIGLSESDTIVKVAHQRHGCQAQVHFSGVRSSAELQRMLLESDIYCQVSHIENSPNSLCEAMLLGMPIVANFAGGTDSLLSSGQEGVLVQDGDPYSMAGAIVELSRDHHRAARMGQAARTRAKARHNADRIIDDLLSTYRQVLGSEIC